MDSIVSAFSKGFTGIIGDLAKGIKDGFTNLIYVDPEAASPVLSAPAQVGLVVGGIALAVGMITGIFGFIRHLRG